MKRIIDSLVISLILFGVSLAEVQELKNSEKWLTSITYFNKYFPNNDEVKLATVLTKAENWPNLHIAHHETGFSKDLTGLPDKLKTIDPALYSEIKGPYDRLVEAYKTLGKEERDNLDLLFASFQKAFYEFFLGGHTQFWQYSESPKWVKSFEGLREGTKANIRSKFPFLVWLQGYWYKDDQAGALIPEVKLEKIVLKMVSLGLHENVLKRAEHSFDYQKLMDALKVEEPAIYAKIQSIAEGLRKAYLDLPEKQKHFISKAFEWEFENREEWDSDYITQVYKGQKDKIDEFIRLFHELTKEEQDSLRAAFPHQLAFIKSYMDLSDVNLHDNE